MEKTLPLPGGVKNEGMRFPEGSKSEFDALHTNSHFCPLQPFVYAASFGLDTPSKASYE